MHILWTETTVIPLKFSPDFVCCRHHPLGHSLPSQNLSPHISLLHQQEHFWPPSHDGLSETELNFFVKEEILKTLTRVARLAEMI